MIQLPFVALPSEASVGLQVYQSLVDEKESYALRVAAAKAEFRRRNVKANSTFRSVRENLDVMCRGARRCMYCEDSVADEVEHYRPKDLYPDVVFAWHNYLYTCGPCNGPKRNFFAIFVDPDARIVELADDRDEPLSEPPVGGPLLIDPRSEDPLTLLQLDIRDTFMYTETHTAGTREYWRANYTIRVLHLNDREYLRVGRSTAFCAFCSMLKDYADRKSDGAPQAELNCLIGAIQRSPHPTVWEEMKRQRTSFRDLNLLFNAAPEALTW